MANLNASGLKYRHKFVVFAFQYRVGIDIDDLDIKRKLAAQCFQRGEHVIAKVAIASTVQCQDRLTYPALP